MNRSLWFIMVRVSNHHLANGSTDCPLVAVRAGRVNTFKDSLHMFRSSWRGLYRVSSNIEVELGNTGKAYTICGDSCSCLDQLFWGIVPKNFPDFETFEWMTTPPPDASIILCIHIAAPTAGKIETAPITDVLVERWHASENVHESLWYQPGGIKIPDITLLKFPCHDIPSSVL